MMVHEVFTVCGTAPAESVTTAMKVYGPAVSGVPVIAPVWASRVRGVGREPGEMENVESCAPPLASIALEYGVPTVAVFAGQAIVSAAGGNVPEYVTRPNEIAPAAGLLNRSCTAACPPGAGD